MKRQKKGEAEVGEIKDMTGGRKEGKAGKAGKAEGLGDVTGDALRCKPVLAFKREIRRIIQSAEQGR